MIKKEITDLDLVSKIESIEKDGMSVFVMADGRYVVLYFMELDL